MEDGEIIDMAYTTQSKDYVQSQLQLFSAWGSGHMKKGRKMYTYTEINPNIWQIAEDEGVYCTLVRGTDLAVLIDTGYGKRNLGTFVEAHIATPYIVMNSHGHSDHIGGNHWFDIVYAAKEEWDVIKHFEGKGFGSYELREIQTDSGFLLEIFK